MCCLLSACDKSNKTTNQNSTANKTTASDVSESGSKYSQGDTVVVPNVVGMDKDEAIKKLEKLGLKVETETKHLTYKDNNNTSLGFYDDGYVLEQDSKAGTVMVKGSAVKLTYNSNTSQFKYKVNEDGTITIIKWTKTFLNDENNFVIIPKEYDGYKVTSIDNYFWEQCDNKKRQINNLQVKIPQGVEYTTSFDNLIVY